MRQGLIALAAAALLSGCVSLPDTAAPLPRADTPHFDPFTFFLGASEGEGTLTKAFTDPVPVRVTSRGRIVIEGNPEASWAAPPRRVLVLDQTVHEGDKPPRTRQWRLREVAPGRYEGTLTTAIGPVTGHADGNVLVLEFAVKGSFKVRQELTLSADGRHAHNVMRASQLGVTAAVLVEDIVRE